MENHHFNGTFTYIWPIFHSYVKLPKSILRVGTGALFFGQALRENSRLFTLHTELHLGVEHRQLLGELGVVCFSPTFVTNVL